MQLHDVYFVLPPDITPPSHPSLPLHDLLNLFMAQDVKPCEYQDVMEDASRLDEPMSSSFVFEQLVFQAEVAEARPASFKYAKCVLDPDTRCSCFTIKRGLQDQRSSLKLVLTGLPYRSASPLRRVNMVMRRSRSFSSLPWSKRISGRRTISGVYR